MTDSCSNSSSRKNRHAADGWSHCKNLTDITEGFDVLAREEKKKGTQIVTGLIGLQQPSYECERGRDAIKISDLWWFPFLVLSSGHHVVMAKRILKQSYVIKGNVFVSSSLLQKCDRIFQSLCFSQSFVFICCHFKVGGGQFGEHLFKCCLEETSKK